MDFRLLNKAGTGPCSVVEAELALIHGLRLAWQVGIWHIVMETDSLLIKSWVENEDCNGNKHAK